MTRESTLENNIRQARDKLDRAQVELNDLLAVACTGIHKPTPHRDRRLPWCENCRRDIRGIEVPE